MDRNKEEKCIIAYYSDGCYRYACCSGDGFPAAAGKVLLEHYDSMDGAARLVDGGDIEVLGGPGTLEYYTSAGPGMPSGSDPEKADILDWFAASSAESEEELTGAACEALADWVYLYTGECWCYKRTGSWGRLDSLVQKEK